MDSWSKHHQRLETPAEERLYRHLLHIAKTSHPSDAIDLFRKLLIAGTDYPYADVQKDLDWILQSGFIDQDFKFILNRSCYIFINAWVTTASQRVYIPELIDVFESLPTSTPYTVSSQHLRRLLKRFVNSVQYRALKCLALTIRASWDESNRPSNSASLQSIIQRYPYIYRHQLVTRGSSLDQRRTVRLMQREAQRQFDVELSRYQGLLKYSRTEAARNDVKNPTLLSSLQLNYALHQFTGKVDGANTQRDLAQQFLTYTQWTRSYKSFKHDLYDYLTPAVRSRFGKHHFNQRLASYLNETLEYYDSSIPSELLISETCKKLLNFLVVESARCPDHMNFIDLIANLGATLTMTLLLKIVLLCQNAKPWLERRLSVLFDHYALRPKGDVIWLVEALENANVALSTNFSVAVRP